MLLYKKGPASKKLLVILLHQIALATCFNCWNTNFLDNGLRWRNNGFSLHANTLNNIISPLPDHASVSQAISRSIMVASVLLATPLVSKSAETFPDEKSVSLDSTLLLEPEITDTCWMELQIGDDTPKRIEIGLYGKIVPKTVDNFKALCTNAPGWGYQNSDIFRVISEFSIQGGNIGNIPDTPPSRLGRDGKSATGTPFPQENFLIPHLNQEGGIISMMKDTKTGLQDSRFFISTKQDSSWADGKYVAFGRVTKGMNTITAITVIPVEPPSNYPKTNIKIVNVEPLISLIPFSLEISEMSKATGIPVLCKGRFECYAFESGPIIFSNKTSVDMLTTGVFSSLNHIGDHYISSLYVSHHCHFNNNGYRFRYSSSPCGFTVTRFSRLYSLKIRFVRFLYLLSLTVSSGFPSSTSIPLAH
eukprot:gene5771-11664_t